MSQRPETLSGKKIRRNERRETIYPELIRWDLKTITAILEISETYSSLPEFRKMYPQLNNLVREHGWEWIYDGMTKAHKFKRKKLRYEQLIEKDVELELRAVRARVFDKAMTSTENGRRAPVDVALELISEFYTKREFRRQYPIYADIASVERRFGLSPKMRNLQQLWKKLK